MGNPASQGINHGMAVNLKPGTRRFPKPGRIGIALILVAASLLLVRAAAPYWIAHRINHKPPGKSQYRWHVGDVDLHLLTASYDLRKVTLHKEGIAAPIFTAERVTSSFRPRELFRTRTVDLEAFNPRLNLRLGPDGTKSPDRSRDAARPDWGRLLHRLTLFRVSGFALHQGEIRFLDKSTDPDVEINLRDVEAEAENLYRAGGDSSHWAGFKADGLLMGSGRFTLRTRIHPEAGSPTFAFDFTLKDMDLRRMDAALRAYAGVAVEKGRMDLETHATATGGKYRGTIRTGLYDFEISDARPKDQGLVKSLKKQAAMVLGNLLEWKSEKNQTEGKPAPKTDFSGTFPDEVADAWSMSEYLLKQAFQRGVGP